jgi:hypothetical protein
MTLDAVADSANEVAIAQQAYNDAVAASGADSNAAKDALNALKKAQEANNKAVEK